MDVDREIQRLEDLMRDSQANLSEIVRIYYCIAKDADASSTIPILNRLAVQLLSPEVIGILKKHGLDAFAYVLVANYLLCVDTVKDELKNGNALTNNIPPIAIRNLKAELGITTAAVPPATQAAALALPAQFDEPQMTMSSTSSVDQAALNTDGSRVTLEIKNKCNDMKNLNGMILYKLPLIATSVVRRFSFGEPSLRENKPWKTILLMGATGSGKTTMINAMINYVLDVRWDDPFRFILIDEKERSQAFSQTREVTAYDIHYRNGFNVPYSLTIVDTPGFGDTDGTERDKEITSAIKKFFENENGIQELNAVGFTVQSSFARLTSFQKDIFNSVLSIFGNDIEENVRFLVTFADGGRPKVLAAIKEAELPCLLDSNKDPCHQSFNNRAVFVSNQRPGDGLSPIEWENAVQNFKLFFTELSKMPTKSLRLTKEVLKIRENLQITIQGLETNIQAHLMKMEELRKIEEIIALHKDDVNANKNFEITVKVAKKKRIEVEKNQKALNCSNCELTCHYPCDPGTCWKSFCPAFYKREIFIHAAATLIEKFFEIMENTREFGKASTALATVGSVGALCASLYIGEPGLKCNNCPKKCATNDHSHEGTRWTYVQEDETRTLDDIRKKYDDAKEKRLNAEELKKALQEEVEQLKSDIIKEMDEMTCCSNLLKKIALRGDSLSTPKYINLMIENENKEKRPGYLERIDCFEDLLRSFERGSV